MKKVITPEFRVSFPSVFQPSAFDEQEAKYRITMLFDKGTDLQAMKKLAAEAVTERWPDRNKRPGNLRNPFRDGDVDKPDVDGYPGHIFVNASSKMKPGVVDCDLQPIIDEEEFYPGCYARASVTAYTYSHKGNNGVAFGLQNIQKIKDGASFSGRSKAEDDFESLVDDDFGNDWTDNSESVEEDVNDLY